MTPMGLAGLALVVAVLSLVHSAATWLKITKLRQEGIEVFESARQVPDYRAKAELTRQRIRLEAARADLDNDPFRAWWLRTLLKPEWKCMTRDQAYAAWLGTLEAEECPDCPNTTGGRCRIHGEPEVRER